MDEDEFRPLTSRGSVRNKSRVSRLQSASQSFYRSLSRRPTGRNKPRILALHGARSNNAVTRMQLENLNVTADRFDITYLQGPVKVDRGDPDVAEIVDGPFYSWFHGGNYSDGRFKDSIFRAVVLVLKVIDDESSKGRGFDAVYGFSQGCTVATLVAATFSDVQLRNMILESLEGNQKYTSIPNRIVREKSYGARTLSSYGGAYTSSSRRFSARATTVSNRDGFSSGMFDNAPFEFIVLACCVDTPEKLRNALGLSSNSFDEESILIPSLHLIGILDPRKPQSEKMTKMFSDAQVKYMAGSGHAVTRTVQQDTTLLRTVYDCLKSNQNTSQSQARALKLRRVSDTTKIGVMSQHQLAYLKLENLISNPTITNILGKRDRSKALFFNARETDSSNNTTYGDVLDFINGGPGDLRRLGVMNGQVVAYGAPPGGGAVPALAFLSIMSQTTAAPLAPGTSEPDALDLLEQFGASHLVLFDGVNYSGGLESAFAKFAATGRATLHRATIRTGGRSKPGMFDYTLSGYTQLDPSLRPRFTTPPIQNPTYGVALLLGTSGTTSRPKGVPILHRSIVQNGHILATSIGLRETDVCYSVMPLFHIGGISASILCTIASGGSVCCDSEAYSPENMVNALALSNPKPTWYSSVPTIHNATVSYIKSMAADLQGYGVREDGIWKRGHNLRLIRSGAAALLGPDAIALSSTYGDVPVYPTYSMSEQMPITQPPNGKADMVLDKPGSVGVPVATSLAIINSANLTVQPYGQEGEIAICGPTVIENYLHNVEADKKSYFELTVPGVRPGYPYQRGRYFLTGDVGVIDKEGFVSLKGRSKELIKKGGEQVSPFEIEEPIIDHQWIEVALCFAVPSKLYGEEVGLAMVLSSTAPAGVTEQEVIKEMREFLKSRNVNPLKWPTKWKVVDDDDLPKTKSKKYIRIGLAKILGLADDVENEDDSGEIGPGKPQAKKNNTFIDWGTISGYRFLLACYVMFMHLGSNESWGSLNNLRGWPWHVHVFFTLGGFSLVAPMNPVIPKKFKYFVARFMAMYPMYLVALAFVFANLLVACRPSTFRPEFHWDSQPYDLYKNGIDETDGISPLFCEGTPLTPKSYWGSLFLTLIVFLFGIAITPIWTFSWWMGYYFWFSAMYYQCLMIFPAMYNKLFKWRGNGKRFFFVLIVLFVLNYALLLPTWFSLKDGPGYNHYKDVTGEKNPVDEYNEDAFMLNAQILGWYLFSPFWMIYFVIGACTAFLYDAYRPAERSNKRIWGLVADLCTFSIIMWSACIIAQGTETDKFLRPTEANNPYTDTSVVNRLWDNICGRFIAPLTTLWIFALATGEGWTAHILGSPFLSRTVAPHAYNCFLFHQPVAQWYYAATRGSGHWWNWWQYRKTMYWFSPAPCPVEWYEYFYLVVLIVGFSSLMNATAEPFMAGVVNFFKVLLSGRSDEDEEIDVEQTLIDAIEDMSGFAPELDWTLDQCGLSSLGLPQLATRLNNIISTKNNPVSITPSQLSDARTVSDIAEALKGAITEANVGGI